MLGGTDRTERSKPMRGMKLLAIAGTATLATMIGGVLPANAVTRRQGVLCTAHRFGTSSDKGEFIGQGNPGTTLTAPTANARTAVSLARTASGELTTFALSGKPATGVHLVTQVTRAATPSSGRGHLICPPPWA